MSYRPAPLFRLLPIFGGLGFFAFAILGVITALVEDTPLGWWAAGGALLAMGYFIYNGWQVAYTLTLHTDHLVFRRLRREVIVRYADIHAAILRQNTLKLTTSENALSLYGDPAGLARVYQHLQTIVPALQRQKQAALTRPLPILYQRDIRPDLIAGIGIATVCLFLLSAGAWAWTTDPSGENLVAASVIACISIILLPVSIMMVATAIRKVTFTQEIIKIHSVLRPRTFSPRQLTDIRLKATPRTVRGIPRTFYTLALYFGTEHVVEIPPTFSDSIGVRQEQARLELADLRTALLNHFPMVTIEKPSNRFAPENRWGKGWITRIFHIKPYSLIIQEENYGEVHRSADSLHYVFDPPIVEAQARFRTVDGNLIYTPDGRYLALYDLAHLIVFDVEEKSAFHRKIRDGYLRGVELAGNTLCVKFLPLGKPASNFVNLPPIPLEELSKHLQPGTGTLPPGDLPTAHPTQKKPDSTIPTNPVASLLAQARAFGKDLPENFENLRDSFSRLGPDAFPLIHEEARKTKEPMLLELLVTVLVDSAYPPAYPDFVCWLDHPNEEIRFFCAFALDHIAEKRFGIETMIQGGWVQHDKIRAVIPQIKEWWERGGMQRVPTMAKWTKKISAPPIPELHKWFNFVELNPWWVKFGDGEVAQKVRGFQLPPQAGIHIVGGQVWLPHAPEAVFGAFVMDSRLGWVSGVYVKQEGKWVEVSSQMVRAEPNFHF